MRGLLDRVAARARKRRAGGFFAAIDKPAPIGEDQQDLDGHLSRWFGEPAG